MLLTLGVKEERAFLLFGATLRRGPAELGQGAKSPPPRNPRPGETPTDQPKAEKEEEFNLKVPGETSLDRMGKLARAVLRPVKPRWIRKPRNRRQCLRFGTIVYNSLNFRKLNFQTYPSAGLDHGSPRSSSPAAMRLSAA